MFGRAKNVGGFALFDNLTIFHHTDPVGKFAHDVEIVGDEEHRHVDLCFEFAQQFEDLRLNGHIQRSCRFVRDQKLWVIGEGHGDHHALALAAGELMRIVLEPCFGRVDADLVEQFENARARRLARHAMVDEQHFGELFFDCMQRVERGHRLLENKADVIAAQLAQGFIVCAHELLALIGDGAGDLRRVRQQVYR